ncbi:hypothetical protein [Pseudomonas sp. Irchel 3E13]|jgi:hypothetical protein|uniref:hypothetical protein n=1 Tax=Pseudomonas sp. Irchel 3E13 TaxID=2008975 RepID=UPI000BA2CF21|nr:hypothetical protein [Pseudomonas sp. Irchel 3E13]
MSVLKLSYDVYHLGVYLAAALMWLLLAFNSRLIFRRPRTLGQWGVPALAVLVSLGLLLLDVLIFLDRSGMLLALLFAGFGAPALAIWCVRQRLRTAR